MSIRLKCILLMLLPVCSGLVSIIISTYSLNRLQYEFVIHKHSMDRVMTFLTFEEKMCMLFSVLTYDLQKQAREVDDFFVELTDGIKSMRKSLPESIKENPRLAATNPECMEAIDKFLTLTAQARNYLKHPSNQAMDQLKVGFISLGLASRQTFGMRQEAEDWLQNNSLANLQRQEELFVPFLVLSNALTLLATMFSLYIFNKQLILPLRSLREQMQAGQLQQLKMQRAEELGEEFQSEELERQRRTVQYLERNRRSNDEIIQLEREIQNAFVEISDLHEAELAIVQYSGDVLCSLNGNGIFTRLNKSCEVFWGYPAESLIGTSVENVIAEPSLPLLLKTLNRAKQDGQSRSVECQHVDVSGIETYFLWTMHWVPEENEFLCVCHDITQKHQMQTLRENICATLSHDMRTPLMSMSTSIELLVMKNAGKSSARELTLLKESSQLSQKLIKLVTDVLDWKKIESGNIGIAENPIKAQDLALEVAERLESLYPLVSTDLITERRSTVSGDQSLLARSLISTFELLIERVSRSQQFNFIVGEQGGKTSFSGFLPEDTNDGDFAQAAAAVVVDSDSIMELNLPMSFYLVENIIRNHGGSISLIIESGFVKKATVLLPQVKEDEQ